MEAEAARHDTTRHSSRQDKCDLQIDIQLPLDLPSGCSTMSEIYILLVG
jgi:hypothetical protein